MKGGNDSFRLVFTAGNLALPSVADILQVSVLQPPKFITSVSQAA